MPNSLLGLYKKFESYKTQVNYLLAVQKMFPQRRPNE